MAFGLAPAIASTDQIPTRTLLPVHPNRRVKAAQLAVDTIRRQGPVRSGLITPP